MHKVPFAFLLPSEVNSPLGRDAIISRAARLLRPFHNIDIPSFAEAILRAHGATADEARLIAPSAVRVEQSRRRAFA